MKTTHSRRAGLRAFDDTLDRLIDQLMDQFREARAEHNIAAAKMRSEFSAEIAELRGELAQLDATVKQARTEYEKKWPRCKVNWPTRARS
jgi:hypothetical protein